MELLLLDLDRFKEINDSLGHAAGDTLLAEVAQRLQKTCREHFVARLGGDEFAILVAKDLESPSLPEHVRSAVSVPLQIAGTRIMVEASLGWATLGRADAPDIADPRGRAGELLRRADVALYAAKRQRSGCERWEPSQDHNGILQFALLNQLREALTIKGAIQAAFQPKVDPANGRTTGWEALVRWDHPDRGLLLPADFLPVAERAGLMPDLTKLMLEQSVALLQEIGHTEPPSQQSESLQVAVNLSASDLLDIDLPGFVAGLLSLHGVSAKALRLEVTESVVMSGPAAHHPGAE